MSAFSFPFGWVQSVLMTLAGGISLAGLVGCGSSTDTASGGGSAAAGNCAAAVAESTVCVQNVTASAGTTVKIPVRLLLPSGCSAVNQVGASFDFDETTLTMTNEVDSAANCGRQLLFQGEVDFWKSDDSHPPFAGCQPLAAGVLTELEFSIPANAAAGAYGFTVKQPNALSLANSAACDGKGAIDGTLTVK